MKKRLRFLILFACCSMLSVSAVAQESSEKEVYTGTIVSTTGRTMSVPFTLNVAGKTTDEEAQQYLSLLASQGQDDLMKVLRKNKLGFVAASGQVGRDLLVVRDTQADGTRRLVVVFERWIGMFEVRGGYRSEDYPFAIAEIFFDAKGKGTGTFISAAQIRIVRDKKTEHWKLEIENFGTFPAKIMGVIRRGKK